MQNHPNPDASTAWSTHHPVSAADAAATAAARAFTAPMKGQLRGVAARQPFDEIMGHVPAPEGVTYEPDTVGGVSGWWCRPAGAEPAGAILYLHGGWYAWGSAAAYRHLAGHVAARAGVPAFVPDYRLAPEHPFPAGALDVRACWQGLVERGVRRIAIVGDSAGGGLALALASHLAQDGAGVRPVAVVALSPVTDLTLSGDSWADCADADPYFTKPQAQGQVDAYLAGHDPADPQASPLFADLAGLPPVRLVVGGDEMLRDDALRYAARAAAAGATRMSTCGKACRTCSCPAWISCRRRRRRSRRSARSWAAASVRLAEATDVPCARVWAPARVARAPSRARRL